ncbi:phospholipase [Bradyrhizobium sp. LHD-71]|uniref:carboxylesterase family protein n=1 Tax=Bradyrhizobium sp. LHD-71 TaxID=3072141 RepID=UPI00280CFA16|nr:phospholipase [Bradyrhizobium sp. LHD-71]MDQ8727204.1 phospholipase [Bradyrhizobium sp. LHD-71]
MTDTAVDDIVALLPPLLQSIDALAFVARYFNPADYDSVLEAAGHPDAALRDVRSRLGDWPERLGHVRIALEAASDAALAAFDGLRGATAQPEGLRAAFRALRQASCAQEALYPLAATLPPVSQFFLDPPMRDDADLLARLDGVKGGQDIGVMHVDNEPGSRGGFSMYVPEYYTAERAWPLVMALHGGSGNGRAFLWSWLRDARSYGAILVSPTATGGTWALMGDDTDTPNLARILDLVRERWNVDANRLLLTGMSDGGTFSYVSGLEPRSPFTHLAPVSASFHPFLAEAADPERLRGLPIHIVHGALDWMFPVQLARQAERFLAAAGASVTYSEIDDLSHAYPREINATLLKWLNDSGA